jgi:hypothetical protein
MPRAPELALRLALDRMVQFGATASDVARQLGLPLSTVRGLRHVPCRRVPIVPPPRCSPATTPVGHADALLRRCWKPSSSCAVSIPAGGPVASLSN